MGGGRNNITGKNDGVRVRLHINYNLSGRMSVEQTQPDFRRKKHLKNKRNRDLLIQYLRRIGGIFCVGIFSIGIFGLVFVLGNLDTRYFAMGAETILLILIIYAIVFFFG